MAEQIPFSIIENALSSLGSSVVKKLGSMYGVGKELKKLEQTLGTLKAILLDAEEQLEKSYAVKDWVKRMKEVVYDVDDLLDDFATYQLRRGGPARQVSHFFSCSSSNQVAFRFHMSGRVDHIKVALDDIKKDIFLLSAIPRNTIHPRGYNKTRRETHSSPSSTSINLDLRNVEIEKIVNLLVSPDNEDIFIVVICGIGGLGKTTLAQLVFNDEIVTKHFEPKLWVCVSDDDSGEGFGANALLKKMTNSKNDVSLDDLKNGLHKQISQKKYLLVLDDVWNKRSEDWEKVRPVLEVGAKGSKILVTTRNTEVSYMGKNTRPFELEGLGEKESWNLFSNITFGGQENSVSEKIINVGKEIVNMCNGVPLIINTLGGILMQFKSDLCKWESICRNENLLSLPHGNDNVLRVLKLSYDNLPTHLKQCFTYCALFPQDYEFEKKLLVQLWIAQGYIQSPNDDEQLEDIGDQYFKELVSRSLLKKVEEYIFNDRLTYKMHDLIHDLAQSIIGYEVLVLRNDVSNISREARHISSLFNDVAPMKAIMGKKAMVGKPIRSFLNLYPNVLEDTTILNSFFPSVTCLRVLSLNDLEIKKVPKSLGNLIHLRYLDLSKNKFEKLPNSITRLKNLQTIKLRSCWNLKKFPKNMRELINLRHLDNDRCIRLTHMPHGMGKLTSLQSLPLFVVGNGKGRLRNHKVGSLSELESLDQLRGSLCIEDLQNARDVKLESTRKFLEKKKNLESLKLEWRGSDQNRGGEGDKWVMEGLQPNPQLQELFIRGYGAKEFPNWMMNDHELASRLPSLIKIEIWLCSECNVLPTFSELPSLKTLKLYYMKELMELKESSSATPLFPSLELLLLGSVTKLKELWRMDLLAEQGSSFPCLSELYIDECYDLASLHLPPSLSKLDIIHCKKLASLELPSSSSLSKLEIHNCSNLASLDLPSSSSLSKLEIHNCSNLASLELPSSSSLSELEIEDCPLLVSFKVAQLPSLAKLTLSSVGYDVIKQIKFVGAPSLKCLSIGRIDRMKSLPKEILQHISGLEKLHIYECSELESLELPSFPSLSKLDIKFCPLSVSFKVDQLPSLATLHLFSVGYDVIQQIKFVGAPSLKCLSIEYIDRLISLPKEVLQHFSGLVRLHIRECRALQSLELPSFHALSKLRIEDCPNLASFNVASLTRLRELRLRRVTAEVLQQLMLAFSSLKLLYIWGIYGKITHLQHDSTLESLYIWNCSGLETLQHWMSSLSSLRALAICHCPELTSLPKEIYSLQKLETLYLSGFQLTDEDRAKIARLPDINLTMDSLADDEV